MQEGAGNIKEAEGDQDIPIIWVFLVYVAIC